MNKFIFDVDGTLTPSRQRITDEFYEYFLEFCNNNDVYLVTGSDRPKTIEQLGEEIYNSAKRVYNCSGNDVWEGEQPIFHNDWVLPEEATAWLTRQLIDSRFQVKTGRHFEHRVGLCNFSILGRNADMDQRARYVYWDKMTGERSYIAESFNGMFYGITATAGGETGLDIYPTGNDKSQIVKYFDSEDTLWFFGDRQDPAGNDYTLSLCIENSHNVKDWEDTFSQLKTLQARGIAK
jgi:phosphomannomutase